MSVVLVRVLRDDLREQRVQALNHGSPYVRCRAYNPWVSCGHWPGDGCNTTPPRSIPQPRHDSTVHALARLPWFHVCSGGWTVAVTPFSQPTDKIPGTSTLT